MNVNNVDDAFYTNLILILDLPGLRKHCSILE